MVEADRGELDAQEAKEVGLGFFRKLKEQALGLGEPQDQAGPGLGKPKDQAGLGFRKNPRIRRALGLAPRSCVRMQVAPKRSPMVAMMM